MCLYINICEYTEAKAFDADDAKLKPEGRPGWVGGGARRAFQALQPRYPDRKFQPEARQGFSLTESASHHILIPKVVRILISNAFCSQIWAQIEDWEKLIFHHFL